MGNTVYHMSSYIYMGGSQNGVTQKWMVYHGTSYVLKKDDLGVPPF